MKSTNALKKFLFYLLPTLFLLVITSCSSAGYQSNMTDQQNVYNLDELNSYGDWINIDPYGEVWQPFVVDGWMPYENGHWAFADGSWTWISYEPFGWIVYHYGYWYDDPFYGWVWIPGDGTWSPANVIWYDYGDYVCWAPLPPKGIEYGHPWDKDHERYWHVVRMNDFTKDNIRDYTIRNPVRAQINENVIVNRPPDRQLIERNIGRPIPEVNIKHDTIRLNRTEIRRMNLPPEETHRVEQQAPRIRREVLVPREKFFRQRSQMNEQHSSRIRNNTLVPRAEIHGQQAQRDKNIK